MATEPRAISVDIYDYLSGLKAGTLRVSIQVLGSGHPSYRYDTPGMRVCPGVGLPPCIQDSSNMPGGLLGSPNHTRLCSPKFLSCFQCHEFPSPSDRVSREQDVQ